MYVKYCIAVIMYRITQEGRPATDAARAYMDPLQAFRSIRSPVNQCSNRFRCHRQATQQQCRHHLIAFPPPTWERSLFFQSSLFKFWISRVLYCCMVLMSLFFQGSWGWPVFLLWGNSGLAAANSGFRLLIALWLVRCCGFKRGACWYRSIAISM